MWPVAIFLMLVVAFYWGAFYISVIAWLNAVGHLIRGNFTRAAAWFAVGCGMLFWWFDENVSFDEWWQMSLLFVTLGALGTFARFYNRHQRAVTPAETSPFEPTPMVVNININIDPRADSRAVHDDLAALAIGIARSHRHGTRPSTDFRSDYQRLGPTAPLPRSVKRSGAMARPPWRVCLAPTNKSLA
jgi:hypothetical protein